MNTQQYTHQTTTEFSLTEYKTAYYGSYGGMYVPEVLREKLENLAHQFELICNNPAFQKELAYYYQHYVGRPSSLYFAKNFSKQIGSRIYLKREDLNHTGAHKINNTVGQILLAKHMNAKEIIAETGAGQHGVATATAAALMGINCKIFMGQKDAERQEMNVYRMKVLGAEVITTNQGTATLKDAINAALEYYVKHPDAFYLLGSAVGPHPYPSIVRFFQSVIGEEAKAQFYDQEGKLPDALFACIGGGSNAIGLFADFLENPDVKIFAAEGGGEGINSGKTASTLVSGKPFVFQGTYSYCLMDDKHHPQDTSSIAAGLDYPGVGPEHAYLKDTGRARYFGVTDQEAIEAFGLLSRTEGIIPAIESAHALALAMKIMKDQPSETSIVNLSGRGDKDMGRKLI